MRGSWPRAARRDPDLQEMTQHAAQASRAIRRRSRLPLRNRMPAAGRIAAGRAGRRGQSASQRWSSISSALRRTERRLVLARDPPQTVLHIGIGAPYERPDSEFAHMGILRLRKGVDRREGSGRAKATERIRRSEAERIAAHRPEVTKRIHQLFASRAPEKGDRPHDRALAFCAGIPDRAS